MPLSHLKGLHDGVLSIDHIRNRNGWKAGVIGFLGLGVDGFRACRSVASTKHMGAKNGVRFRIKGLAVTDEIVPPACFFVIAVVASCQVGIAC
jgi:hypothetical protein